MGHVVLCEACLSAVVQGVSSTSHQLPLLPLCLPCLLCSLSHKMVVSEVLQAAQALVYKYCQLSAKKGLHLVNPE